MSLPAHVSVPIPRPAPMPNSRRAATRFFIIVGALGLLVIYSMAALWRKNPAALFWTTLLYFTYELGLNALLVTAAWFGLRARRRAVPVSQEANPRPGLAVLIAAHNERACIFDTLDSVFAQDGVDEVIVASDGSTDGMNAALIERYSLRPDPVEGHWRGGPGDRLLLLALPKLGKGGVLNAALAQTRAEVAATLDADTRLAPDALGALADAFRDPLMASAGGFVYVRNAARGPWLVRYQYWEYVKNFMWRVGLAHLGVCLQVSGAFGAFRTRTLREIGGFSGASLVEDYEVIYRLHERMRSAGREYRVEVVPDAVAYTDSPDTVPSFVHQRTRWFAGFLQTLWEYRRMVGNPRMGLVGGLMLPIKCVDAILPVWGSLSLAVLLAATLHGSAAWERAGLFLFLARWLIDLGLSGVMWTWHRRLFPGRGRELPGVVLGLHMATEGLVFNWFRQIAVLNAYSWFVRRVQKWHQPRWQAAGSENVRTCARPASFVSIADQPQKGMTQFKHPQNKVLQDLWSKIHSSLGGMKFVWMRRSDLIFLPVLLASATMLLGMYAGNDALELSFLLQVHSPTGQPDLPELTAYHRFGYLGEVNHGLLYLFVAPVVVFLGLSWFEKVEETMRDLIRDKRLLDGSGDSPTLKLGIYHRFKSYNFIVPILIFVAMLCKTFVFDGRSSLSKDYNHREGKDFVPASWDYFGYTFAPDLQQWVRNFNKLSDRRRADLLYDSKFANIFDEKLRALLGKKSVVTWNSPVLSAFDLAEPNSNASKKAVFDGLLAGVFTLTARERGSVTLDSVFRRAAFGVSIWIGWINESFFQAFEGWIVWEVILFLILLNRSGLQARERRIRLDPNYLDENGAYGFSPLFRVYSQTALLVAFGGLLFNLVSLNTTAPSTAEDTVGGNALLGKILTIWVIAAVTTVLVAGPGIVLRRRFDRGRREYLKNLSLTCEERTTAARQSTWPGEDKTFHVALLCVFAFTFLPFGLDSPIWHDVLVYIDVPHGLYKIAQAIAGYLLSGVPYFTGV